MKNMKQVLYGAFAVLQRAMRSMLQRIRLFVTHVDKRYPKARRMVALTVSVVLTVSILCSVLSAAGLTYALEVSVNGTVYGFVNSRQEAESAIAELCSSLETGENRASVTLDANYSYTVVSSDSLISASELVSTVVNGEDDYRQILGIFANGRLVSYSDSAAVAQQTLMSAAGGEDFYFDLLIHNCVVTQETFLSLVPVEKIGACSISTVLPYTCVSGDSAARIAERFGISEALVEALNLSATYEPGSTVNLVMEIPVTTTVQSEESQKIYTIPARDTNEKAKIVTETVRTVSVFGVPYAYETVSRDESEVYANKPTANKIVSVGSYGFCWPLDKAYDQYVSSYWGDGRGHRAVDIAGKTGIPILSVLNGVVCSVNNSGSGYGKHFEIDHGNGLRTLYAHCSKLYVSVGDRVSRGEVVALVGSTGNSTGSHLHFEVIKNGVKVNPCSYLGLS